MPHLQILTPMHVSAGAQSASFQHSPRATAAGLQIPAPPSVHAAPTQRLPVLQSVSLKQQPDGGSLPHVVWHGPLFATFTPATAAPHGFRYVLSSQPQTGS